MELSSLEHVWLANEAIHTNQQLADLGRPPMLELVDIANRRWHHYIVLREAVMRTITYAPHIPPHILSEGIDAAIQKISYPDSEQDICQRGLITAMQIMAANELQSVQAATPQEATAHEDGLFFMLPPPEQDTDAAAAVPVRDWDSVRSEAQSKKPATSITRYKVVTHNEALSVHDRATYSEDSTYALRNMALTGDSIALSLLLEEHHQLIDQKAQAILAKHCAGGTYELEDLRQEGAALFIELLPQCTANTRTIGEQMAPLLHHALRRVALTSSFGVPLSEGVARQCNMIAALDSARRTEGKSPATNKEIAAHLGVPVKDAIRKQRAWQITHNLGHMPDGGDLLNDTMYDQALENAQLRVTMQTIFKRYLTEEQALIITKRFGLTGDSPMIIADIAAALDMPVSRVQNREKQAFARLAKAFDMKALRGE